MSNGLAVAQIVLAILLISAILTQQRGTALGGAFGGGSEVYRTRRGIEKLLFRTTIILGLAFMASIIASLLV